jgi:hypothetical protein
MGLILFMGSLVLMAYIGVAIAVYINRDILFPKRYNKHSA